ncbi:hypothetical protein LWI29_000855 [Acer saccharum]|uniref:indole-3-glycerol-phosphate synthase n=1 Tax=Acer saccharum TaxID=4024 RepID=A0AA39SER6_ACESA|nr:hypothetical protein LWI29_000855 [Acer saccharum]
MVGVLSFGGITRTEGIRFDIDREECFSYNVHYEGVTLHLSFVFIKADTPWHFKEDGVDLVELLPCQVSFTETSLLQLLATVFRTCFGISKLSEAAAKQETKDESATVSPANGDVDTALKVKEWEVGMFHKEVAATQGIQIRRRPPTGPPQHYNAPFEFRIQSEGKTPCNILEEIIWHKDVEVAQLKERRPLFRLKNALDSALPTKDFVGALRAAHQRTGLPSLIAEVKKASPSRGILREDFDPEGKLHEANRMFSEMKSMNVTPNILTYNTLINGFSQTSNGEMGGRLYEEMVRNGIKVDILTYNALILGLCKVGKRKKAAYLVKDLDKGNLVPNASTFSALITGQCVRNNSENAFQLYKGI